MGSGAPSCWGGSLGIQPEWPVPGRFPTPSATFPQSHVGRGRKPTHIRLRFSPPGEDLGGLVNRGSLAELPSPREAGARRCWIPALPLHSGGPWVPVGGARLWEPHYITLFPPQAMTGLEQPLKPPLHFYTARKRMMPAACTGARVPLCWKAPTCFLRSCESAGRDCRPVPELPEAEASPLCSRDTVSPTLSRRGQSWHGWLDNGGTRHQARLGAQRARRRSWPCM